MKPDSGVHAAAVLSVLEDPFDFELAGHRAAPADDDRKVRPRRDQHVAAAKRQPHVPIAVIFPTSGDQPLPPWAR